ncbi:hypothetical protein [Methanococcoides burtonii]|uniref:Uncharacterized protein n=1 Tax=Methanococcoides burtonii (strain DSM 6242 / NBRC 107633 / OCM 468 / ACE-M) TaxID=259564 RepID=Q12UZ8_METBU|nr:hypothetical protein [Methanococcoides burtonii]ABE52728.1 Hypothetical protein Mbur_1845 [Methanococcoides burtonii DSM 6242]
MIPEVQDLMHNIAKYLSRRYASALFGLLLVVTILYYYMEYFYPNKYDLLFMLTGQIIGSVLFGLAIIAMIAFILLLFRKVNK